MKTYNKLVRDKIPEIIKQAGKECRTRVLGDEEYRYHLDKKLTEELEEYISSGTISELADLIEVIFAIVLSRGMSLEAFDKLRREKCNQRGGFKEKLLLEYVKEH